jgi:hypothetical protein
MTPEREAPFHHGQESGTTSLEIAARSAAAQWIGDVIAQHARSGTSIRQYRKSSHLPSIAGDHGQLDQFTQNAVVVGLVGSDGGGEVSHPAFSVDRS